MKQSLDNQVAVIFGATGRVGSTIAEKLADKNVQVAVHYNRNIEAAERIVEKLTKKGCRAKVFQADMRIEKDLIRLGEEIIDEFGELHIIVNTVHPNFDPVLVKNMRWGDWTVHLDALKSHFLACKFFLPYLRKQKYGRIIFISAGLSKRFYPGCSAYSTIKAGLNAFCKTLAIEEGENNITVNIVAPGKVIPIEGGDSVDNPAEWEEMDNEFFKSIPLKREATSEDVADTVLYFASPSSSFITGQTIFVAGGEIM